MNTPHQSGVFRRAALDQQGKGAGQAGRDPSM
jgi:hypothetical protein